MNRPLRLLLFGLCVLSFALSGQSLNETFNHAPAFTNNWQLAFNHSSTITYTPGNLRIQAPQNPYPPGGGAILLSNQVFSGDVDVSFQLNKHGYGQTKVGLFSTATGVNQLYNFDLDTDDEPCLFTNAPSLSQAIADCPSSQYMNRWLTLRIQLQGSIANFYADGNLLHSVSSPNPVGSYRIGFGAGSVPWKSGANDTSFRQITAVVASNQVSFTTSTKALSFAYQAGVSGPILPQLVNLLSSVPGVAFSSEAITNSGGKWLSVSPSSGITPALLTVNVALGLTVGVYTATIPVTLSGLINSVVSIAVTLNVTAPPLANPSLSLVDPIPNLVMGMPAPFVAVNSQPEAYVAAGLQFRKGVAADGITPLLIRCLSTAPGTAVFTLVDVNGTPLASSADNGTLSNVQGDALLAQPTITTSKGELAVALYTAPPSFWRTSADSNLSERSVFVKVNFVFKGQASIATAPLEIKIARPPVMLVHGIWSNPDAWSAWGNFGLPSSSNLDPGSGCTDSGKFFACTMDYETDNYQNFTVIAPKVGFQIRNGLTAFRQQKQYAAIQADVIAHSLGGNVIRTMPLCGNAFKDCDSTYHYYEENVNLAKGDVHKLITIATPHKGSPLATAFIQNESDKCCYWKDTTLVCTSGTLASQFVQMTQDIIGGALNDLQVGSDALTRLNKVISPFPILFVVGISSTQDESLLSAPTALVPRVNKCGFGKILPSNIRDLYGSDSDLVVSVNSQRGGLLDSADGTIDSWPDYDYVIHTSALNIQNPSGAFSNDELHSSKLATQVINLLDSGKFVKIQVQ